MRAAVPDNAQLDTWRLPRTCGGIHSWLGLLVVVVSTWPCMRGTGPQPAAAPAYHVWLRAAVAPWSSVNLLLTGPDATHNGSPRA